MPSPKLYSLLTQDSFLEYAFLRWVLTPAATISLLPYVDAQQVVNLDDRNYRIDYAITGKDIRIAIELDGYEFHSNRQAFTYDRLRQNDLCTLGYAVLRFSYESIRLETERCITQLQTLMRTDTLLERYVIVDPIIEKPEMDSNPIYGIVSNQRNFMDSSYFDLVRNKINYRTLRECQVQAYSALANYYRSGGQNAATVMAVGAGKTALGVVSALAFTQRRALIITPGNVIRGTFDRALDHEASNNALYGLPSGPLIPGCLPPTVLILDREEKAISSVTADNLKAADIIVTNFHSLGNGHDPNDLLAKLAPDDIDLIIVDEAHIAAAESYQRAFQHFVNAKTLLMSACFQRLDGKPIQANVVYNYRLIDSIAEGNAKNLRVHRFAPNSEETTYELTWPDGRRDEIKGKDALLTIIKDERKLALITAKSYEPIRQVMRAAKAALDQQTELLFPVKPRVLFSALGERHAQQIAKVATDYGIKSDYLHHSMAESRIKAVRERFERDSGDLQGIVQLKMLGQGYDFPPITIVVPMRPYGSFSEFYQFIGRGIRILNHPALSGRVGPSQQFLDIIYHAELGLDDHIDTIYRENDMDPDSIHNVPANSQETEPSTCGTIQSDNSRESTRPETQVLFQPGTIQRHIVHDEYRVEQRRAERERDAWAQRYAQYVQSTDNPATFEQYQSIMKMLGEK